MDSFGVNFAFSIVQKKAKVKCKSEKNGLRKAIFFTFLPHFGQKGLKTGPPELEKQLLELFVAASHFHDR